MLSRLKTYSVLPQYIRERDRREEGVEAEKKVERQNERKGRQMRNLIKFNSTFPRKR